MGNKNADKQLKDAAAEHLMSVGGGTSEGNNVDNNGLYLFFIFANLDSSYFKHLAINCLFNECHCI